MKVKEIMQKVVISLSPKLSAKEGLVILLRRRISGLPVVDKNGRLKGMFTEKDFLRYLLPSYLDKVGEFRYEENPKYIKQKISQLAKVKLSDIMRKEVVTVEEDFTLSEVARIMLIQKARRIPVVSREGVVVGMVAREDIVRALLHEGNS